MKRFRVNFLAYRQTCGTYLLFPWELDESVTDVKTFPSLTCEKGEETAHGRTLGPKVSTLVHEVPALSVTPSPT